MTLKGGGRDRDIKMLEDTLTLDLQHSNLFISQNVCSVH